MPVMRLYSLTAMMEDIQENLFPSSLPNEQPLSIDEELWLMAEERAQEILCIIQPNVISEVNRKEIIGYVQRLITGYYGAEVFTFGSVPLKTYLPDGDIDLTALGHENAEEDLAQTVFSILESSDNTEFQVKDVQHIRAQVQVVKCTVKDIAVDISFNQMAGLYALRFLEQVDQLVGKNHLFKRSIILIKAWCYYESRILGAHHGLLSTYALETLVLYIINRYHSSVRGPLEVLYRFLDYYSAFDWESDYVSVDGPKALSSLPEINETPDCERDGFLLNKEFLRKYRDMCSISARTYETTTHEFPTKHMNILDPLRNDNNLGRSVSRGNLHRIRFALSFGARKLKEILTLPGEKMGAALEGFFMNTLDRNGKGQRPDIEVPVPAFGTGRSEESVLLGDCESYYGALRYVQLHRKHAMPFAAYPSTPLSAAQADIHAVLTQQNWNVSYKRSSNLYVPIHTDVYVPRSTDVYAPIQNDVYVPTKIDVYAPAQTDVYGSTQTFYCPKASQASYSFEETGKSRGTGTYIPDVAHNSQWDMRIKGNKSRRYRPAKHSVSPKSPQKKQPSEEVHSDETPDASGNSRSFELANEEFPVLPNICQESMSEAQEPVSFNISEQSRSSSSSEVIFEFGTYRNSEAPKESSMPTKGEKEDSDLPSSEGRSAGCSRVAVQSRKEYIGNDKKRD
ncbi:hypothetical protein Ahy_B10g105299 isoform B [Arachis hypogaea]|uniref:Polymerase nucleotidyl transferase domain-containing protein n=2 Tax=Arachis hypogaea TaxID=3818 RepID=A0A444X7N3_ARAHY|nr:hypothetical protein Ahy_B10g105299 isoform B [Arachis hypogaea]